MSSRCTYQKDVKLFQRYLLLHTSFTLRCDPKMNCWRGVCMSYLTDSTETLWWKKTAGTVHWWCDTSTHSTWPSSNGHIRHGLQHLFSSYLRVTACGTRSKSQGHDLPRDLAVSIDFQPVLLIKGADTEWGRLTRLLTACNPAVGWWDHICMHTDTHTHTQTSRQSLVGIYNAFSKLAGRGIDMKS